MESLYCRSFYFFEISSINGGGGRRQFGIATPWTSQQIPPGAGQQHPRGAQRRDGGWAG